MAGELVVVVRDRLHAADFCPAVTEGATVTLDLGHVEPDLATVDALARLHLAAARGGGRVKLRNVPPALAELLELAGLSAVLT